MDGLAETIAFWNIFSQRQLHSSWFCYWSLAEKQSQSRERPIVYLEHRFFEHQHSIMLYFKRRRWLFRRISHFSWVIEETRKDWTKSSLNRRLREIISPTFHNLAKQLRRYQNHSEKTDFSLLWKLLILKFSRKWNLHKS